MRICLLLVMLLPFTQTVFADGDLERSNLEKFVAEIDFLIERVDQIQQTPISDQRIIFNYQYLRSDLQKIKAGIRDHLNRSLATGRRIKPLKGDYEKGVHH